MGDDVFPVVTSFKKVVLHIDALLLQYEEQLLAGAVELPLIIPSVIQKNLHVIKDGGTIILAGACNEGMGSAVFEEWMTSAEKPSDLTERIRREFVLGGHKAAAIAQILDYADITLISEMDPDFVRSIFMRPCGDLQKAFDEAVEKHGKDATVIVMPFGGATLPAVRTQD